MFGTDALATEELIRFYVIRWLMPDSNRAATIYLAEKEKLSRAGVTTCQPSPEPFCTLKRLLNGSTTFDWIFQTGESWGRAAGRRKFKCRAGNADAGGSCPRPFFWFSLRYRRTERPKGYLTIAFHSFRRNIETSLQFHAATRITRFLRNFYFEFHCKHN